MKFLKKVETLPTTLEEGVLYYTESNNKIVIKATPTVEVVDLGLSVNWMTCNIGATKPEEYGKFFQWGDTVGYEDASHSTWDTCPWDEFTSPMTTLDEEHDAAYQATNGVAHMPTQADFEELTANTTITWEINFNGSGVNGRKFTASNGNYIFIPASGYAFDGSVDSRDDGGYVWSSSLYSSYSSLAWYLYFDNSGMDVSYGDRANGLNVRGVVSK